MNNDLARMIVDARGHRCPVPSLRLRRALEDCADDTEVVLLADDPLARIDIPHLINTLGYMIVSEDYSGGQIRFTVRKSAAPAPATAGPAT